MRRRKQLEKQIRAAELMYAHNGALLYKLNNIANEGVDVNARNASLRELHAAHEKDLEHIIRLRAALSKLPPETVMQRLGDVLYWLGCGLAVLCAFVGVLIAENVGTAGPLIVFGFMAVGIWLGGRACRYVLAAE